MNAKQLTEAFLNFRNAKNNEETMPSEITVCDCCERQVAATIGHKGKQLCTACIQMRGSVANRLDSVLGTIREFNGSLAQLLTEDERREVVGTAEHVAKDENIEVVAKINDDLVVENDKLNKEISELRKLAVDHQEALNTIERHEHNLVSRGEKINELIALNTSLEANIEEMKCNISSINAPLVNIALDLAQHHISGKLVVSADGFAELRRVATA